MNSVFWAFGGAVLCWAIVAGAVIATLRKANPVLFAFVITGAILTGSLLAFCGWMIGGALLGQERLEYELSQMPPSSMAENPVQEVVEEVLLYVHKDASVTVDDYPIEMEELAAYMTELRESADADGKKVVVTLQSDEYAPYNSVVQVLNKLSEAQIKNVTFEVPE